MSFYCFQFLSTHSGRFVLFVGHTESHVFIAAGFVLMEAVLASDSFLQLLDSLQLCLTVAPALWGTPAVFVVAKP